MSRTATLKKLLGDDWSLEFVDADGDCFFACVSKAFDGDPTTQELRDTVADACDDGTLESFRAARAAGLEDYVACFTAALEMDNHAVREAGGHMLREVPIFGKRSPNIDKM